MNVVLRTVVIVMCIVVLAVVVHSVKHERLLLRYSMLWLALAAAILLCAVFPDPLYSITSLLGFEAPSNFIFFAGFLFLLLIALSLSSIVSTQAISIKNLVQRLALVEHELEQVRVDGLAVDEEPGIGKPND